MTIPHVPDVHPDAAADAEPTSPCTGVCTLDDSGTCKGCGRTLAEIARWPEADDHERRRILDRLRASALGRSS
jgi:predicted Fe-S protein YdhL (DUF1289 family)